MAFDRELLDILACPACRESLEEVDRGLRCLGCGRTYPVEDGIPVLLIDRAIGGDDEASGTSGSGA